MSEESFNARGAEAEAEARRRAVRHGRLGRRAEMRAREGGGWRGEDLEAWAG